MPAGVFIPAGGYCDGLLPLWDHLKKMYTQSALSAYNNNKMKKNILLFYYIISVLFLIFIAVLIGYRINDRLKQNLTAVRKQYEELKIIGLSTYLAEGSFDSEYFKHKMQTGLRNTNRLLLLNIYSREKGIFYLITKNKNYLATDPEEPSSWSGQPVYRLDSIQEIKLTSSFAPGIRQDLFIDGIFLQFNRADLYPVLKEALYFFLVYVLFSGMILLFLTTSAPAPIKESKRMPAMGSGLEQLDAMPAAPPQTSSRTSGLKSLLSPDTGLGWQEHLKLRLRFELERAASFDQDLSLLIISLDQAATGRNDRQIYRQMGKMILERFPFRDLSFEHENDSYAVILPDKNLDAALKDAKIFQKSVADGDWSGRRITVSIGLSARNGRLISEERLLLEAGKALEQATEGGGIRIIAFRADPDKFRRLISARRSTG